MKTTNPALPFNELDSFYVKSLFKERDIFSHKGDYGHALLIAGSYGKMGAAVLASKGCMRSGVGLLTAHIPKMGYQIMQVSVPEVMCNIDNSDVCFSEFPDLKKFDAIGVGPGLGMDKLSELALKKLIENSPDKMVIDADAINIIASHKELLDIIPANTIITPHTKEFERVAGSWNSPEERLQKQLEISNKHKVIIVLKGANTCITLPDGSVYINSTGNPGMATAGSGDVLTGIILSLLAQSYAPAHTAQIGVFIHGLAGDIAAREKGEISLIAGDITDNLSKAFNKVLLKDYQK